MGFRANLIRILRPALNGVVNNFGVYFKMVPHKLRPFPLINDKNSQVVFGSTFKQVTLIFLKQIHNRAPLFGSVECGQVERMELWSTILPNFCSGPKQGKTLLVEQTRGTFCG